MELLVYVGIYACFTLVALGTVAVLGFGIRGLQHRKVSPLSAAMVGGPIILALLLSLVLGDWVKGSVVACIVIFSFALVAIMVNGVRGLLST